MQHKGLILTITAMALLAQSMNPHPSRAQETEELKPVEVFATRSPLAAENLPASVTVILEEEIQKKKYHTVEDLLRGELGMDVTQSGPTGGLSTVFMRGANSSSTLVMVDGVQVNQNTAGLFNFADLTTDNIERIEILRGPQSMHWGADAVGGVINIVTKKGSGKPTHTLSFEAGSFDTYKESFSSSGAIRDFDYSFSASRTDSEGFSAISELRGATEDDGYGNTTLSGRFGVNFLEDGRIEFIGRYTHSNLEFDDAFGVADNGNFSNSDQFYIAFPIQKTFGGWWEVKLNPNFAYDETFSFLTFGHSKIFNRTYTADLQNTLDLGKFFTVIFGGEYQVQNGVSVGTDLDETLYSQGYFLQTIFEYDDSLVLTGGFRKDIHSDFEDPTTYKFEGAYKFQETGTRVRAAYATGFRAPTINDLFFPPFIIFGFTFDTSNPNLKPEEVKSWEVGVDQQLLEDRVRVGITYFDSHFTNLIQLDSAFVPQNVGKAFSRGIETEIVLLFPCDIDLSLKHTWNEAIGTEAGPVIGTGPLPRRAKHKFSGTLHHNWKDKLDTLVGLLVRSNAPDTSGRSTDAFTTVRAVLSYRVTDKLKVTARGENLFDEKYEEIATFGTPRVSGFFGFVWDLN